MKSISRRAEDEPARGWSMDVAVFAATFVMVWTFVLLGLVEREGLQPKALYWLLQPDQAGNLYGWLIAQYKINYFQYGFVKRGLIGTLLTASPRAYWYDATLVYNAVVISGLAGFIAYFFCRIRKTHGARVCVLLATEILVGSLGILNIGADFGRFDYVNFVLLLTTLVAARRGYLWLPLGLTVVALLIHEAYCFYGVPLVCLYLVDRHLEGGGGWPRRLVPCGRYRAQF